MKDILRFILIICLLLFIISGCEEKDLYSSRTDDEAEMSVLKNEIEVMANQKSCDNSTDWKFVEIGAQACGGPKGFIAYSTKIDVALFLNKVAIYTQKQKAFNVKWDVISTCALLVAPKGVECVGGKPSFVY